MEASVIDDDLWTLIEPLLPQPKPRGKSDPGRPRVSDRAALNGILFMMKTAIRWSHLPTRLEFGLEFGSGAICWRNYTRQASSTSRMLPSILPLTAKRRSEHGSELVKFRWVVERTPRCSTTFAVFVFASSVMPAFMNAFLSRLLEQLQAYRAGFLKRSLRNRSPGLTDRSWRVTLQIYRRLARRRANCTEHVRRAFLHRDLARMHIELLRQFGQRPLAFDRCQRHLRFEHR